jgi:hypothetical protein
MVIRIFSYSSPSMDLVSRKMAVTASLEKHPVDKQKQKLREIWKVLRTTTTFFLGSYMN